MRALTIIPGEADSAALEEFPEPSLGDGSVLVQSHALGVCGTDREMLRGEYGEAPRGQRRLVLGHESVGRVLDAPRESGFVEGDWIAAIVRRPDPVPCANCAAGEWDMCRNGLYAERGIKGLHGFACERYRLEPEFGIKVAPHLCALGVLIEPTSVVAKAWDHIERIGRRARFEPQRVLVTGAGPIGLLAALMGVQRGLRVHVLDRVEGGPKPALVRELGAEYHVGSVEDACADADIVLECTGVPEVIVSAIGAAAPNGIVCLTGVSSGGTSTPLDVGSINRKLVLHNNVVFGSVNANRGHYLRAAEALARAERSWLERLIPRRVPLERWQEALVKRPSDVKTLIVFSDGTP
jgi:threonine dehydrogenase-like Zn-dependent dehydrogenase